MQGNMQLTSASMYCSAVSACYGACNCYMYNHAFVHAAAVGTCKWHIVLDGWGSLELNLINLTIPTRTPMPLDLHSV